MNSEINSFSLIEKKFNYQHIEMIRFSRTQKNPKISIIIPAHNVENFIQECIYSLINQTYKHFEIIIIENGSCDNTLIEIEKLYISDDRITWMKIDKANAALARNIGLKFARGEYIIFLDSDDYFANNLLEKLLDKANESDADIIVCDTYIYDNKNDVYKQPKWSLRQEIFNGETKRPFEIANDIFNFTNNWPWNKFIKKDLINKTKLQFQEISHTNDTFFITAILTQANSIAIVNDRLIYYRINNNSLTSDNKRKYSVQEVFQCLDKIKNYLVSKNIWSLYSISFKKLCIVQLYWNYNKLDSSFLQNEFRIKLIERNFYEINLINDLKFFTYDLKIKLYSLIDTFIDRENIELNLRHEISEHKYISIDIFDTLLFRPFIKPSDLFLALEIIYNADGYCNARIDAEKEARKISGKEEISYSDIYDVLDDKYKFLKDIELEYEISCSIPNSILIKCIKTLSFSGNMFFSSDMYLDKDIISRIVNQYINIKNEQLIVSSNILMTKSSGSLYDYLINHFSINKKELLHIGNNIQSDYRKPLSMGIKSLLYDDDYSYYFSDICYKFLHIKCSTMLQETLSSINFSLLSHGKSLNINNYYSFLGYMILGPITILIAKFLLLNIDKYNPDAIFFIGRDGYFLKLFFDKYTNLNIPNYYINGSRIFCEAIVNDNEKLYEYRDYVIKQNNNFVVPTKILLFDSTTINCTAQKFIKKLFPDSDIFGVYWLANKNENNLYDSIFTRPCEIEKVNFLVEYLLSAPYTLSVNFINDKIIYKDQPYEFERRIILDKIYYGLELFWSYYNKTQFINYFDFNFEKKYIEKLLLNYINYLNINDDQIINHMKLSGNSNDDNLLPLSYYISKIIKYKVSIIICIYNDDKYITECLDSCLNQTLDNIQIIIINDKSSDNSEHIILEKISEYNDIIYLKNYKNIGLASSRNKALNYAKGEYIQFLDSDDYITNDCCKELYNYAKKWDLDVLSFSGFNLNRFGEKSTCHYWEFKYFPKDFKKIWFTFNDCKDFANLMAVSSCLTIYKNKFIQLKNLNFPDGILYEDNLFFTKAITLASRIGVHQGKFYMRRVHENSITQNRSENFEHYIKITIMVLDYLKSINVDYYVINNYKQSYISTVKYFIDRFSYKEKIKYLPFVTDLLCYDCHR